MACSSLAALPRVCSDGVIGGVEKVWMIAFNDLNPLSGSGITDVYSASTNGIVTQIGFDSGKKYVEIGLLKSTSGMNEALTKDNTKGVSFYTQTFTLVLSDLTVENTAFIKSVTNQPVSIIYKTRTGKYFVAGLNGQMEVTTVTGGSGIAEADAIGHTITFAGISASITPMLDSSLISTYTA